MTNEEIQSIMNTTFGNLVFFCRDLDLDEKHISQYQAGQILEEKAFSDVSYKIGGMVQNCRYLIASSNWRDLSNFNPDLELGHAVIQSGSLFKVLDVQKENGKTQILLLNIPREGVEIFCNSEIDLENNITEKGIEIFSKNLAAAPVEELQSYDWIERTSFPLGMNKQGELFMKRPMGSE
tara:strand:- start:58 stop:597 length:540 start_codon:yes stop_codon:yes gene_type:complete